VDCVSIGIAFMPVGLPIAVNAGLTITANIMRKQKVLCKSLKTIETLGYEKPEADVLLRKPRNTKTE